MSIELEGARGRMSIDDGGQITFLREGRVLLQSPAPGFVLAYGIELPADSLLGVERRGEAIVARYASQDEWAVLTLEAEPSNTGFRLYFTVPPKPGGASVGVAWQLRPQGPWYGQGERFVQPWPLDRLPAIADPFIPYDNARDGSLCIATPLWLNAAGAGVLALEESGELEVTLDRGGDGLLRIAARLPERTGAQDLNESPPKSGALLALDILLAGDAPAAHSLATSLLGHPTNSPPADLIARPIWTTWARYKMAVTQAEVMRFAQEIADHDYPRSVLEIDDRWQSAYGETDWDYDKFPEPRQMVAALHGLGFRVTLWVPPFFQPGSAAFDEAAERGYLICRPLDDQPALVRWWQGYGGIIDVTNRDAMEWWRVRLARLQNEYGIDGFKFDAGEGNFVPGDRLTTEPLLRRRYADYYVSWVAEHFAWTEVRSGWRSQRHGILFREWDKLSRWGIDNGLHSVLTQALALSVTGYPFILPDMIGGNAYDGEDPDAELLIRWTQLTALLPAMQFSVPPWEFDAKTDAICRRYALLHAEIASYIQSQIEETLRTGVPLVRPLFWHDPHDEQALATDDQFLLGERLLVAPVVTPGQRARDIYLPNGNWRDWWNSEIVSGPGWIKDSPAPLDRLPLFERVMPGSDAVQERGARE